MNTSMEEGEDRLAEVGALEAYHDSGHLVLLAEGVASAVPGVRMDFRSSSEPSTPSNTFTVVIQHQPDVGCRSACAVLRAAVRPEHVLFLHAGGTAVVPVRDLPADRIPGLAVLLDSFGAAARDGAREALGFSAVLSVDEAFRAALGNACRDGRDENLTNATVASLGVLAGVSDEPLLFVRLSLELAPL